MEGILLAPKVAKYGVTSIKIGQLRLPFLYERLLSHFMMGQITKHGLRITQAAS